MASSGYTRRPVLLGALFPLSIGLTVALAVPPAAATVASAVTAVGGAVGTATVSNGIATVQAPNPRAGATNAVVKFNGSTCGASIRVKLKGLKGRAKGSKQWVTRSAGNGKKVKLKLVKGKYKAKFPASVSSGSCSATASKTKKKFVVKKGKRAKVSVRYGSFTSSAQATEVLELTNAARAKSRTCGNTNHPAVGPLSSNSILQSVAQAHSQDMANRGYFDHTNLAGKSPFDRMEAAGYNYRSAGENIAAGQPTPSAVVQAWIDSPGHCRNIMSGSFTELGVGIATGGDYGIYWTQNFGTPR